MTFGFIKPKFIPFFFSSLDSTDCCAKFHTRVAKDNDKLIWSESLGYKVEQNKAVLASGKRHYKLHALCSIFIMYTSNEVKCRVLKTPHKAFVLFP
jgi:hypothetical protein